MATDQTSQRRGNRAPVGDITIPPFTGPASLPYVPVGRTTDPGVTDDISEGHSVGKLWTNDATDTTFVCVDNTEGAAVWQALPSASAAIPLTLDDVAARKDADSYPTNAPPQAGVTRVIQADLTGILWNLVAADVTLDASWIGLPYVADPGGGVINNMLELDEGGLPNIVRTPQKLTLDRDSNINTMPVILFVGDSMIGTKRNELESDIAKERFGDISQFGLDGPSIFGGAAVTDYTYWPSKPASSTHRQLTSVSGDVYSNKSTTLNVECDEITIYYAKENGAGEFKMKAGPVAGPFVDYGPTGAGTVLIDADNGGAVALGIARIKVPRGSYTLALEHTSGGTINILRASFRKSWSKGIGINYIYEGSAGIAGSPEGYIRTNPAIMSGIIEDLGVHVVYNDFYDGEAQDAHFRTLYSDWNSFSADREDHPEWVYISRPVNGANSSVNIQGQKDHARYLRNLALDTNESFIDVASAFGHDGETEGLMGAAGDVHVAVPNGSLVEWNYVFDRLPYLGGVASRSSGLIAQNSIVHLGDAPQLILRSLDSVIRFQFPNTGGSSTGNITRKYNKLNAAVGTTAGSTGYVNLQEDIYSGISSGGGTYFYTSGVGFYVRMIGRIPHADSIYRVLLGASSAGVDLTTKGIGLEVKSNGVYLIAHDGTTRVASTDFLPTITSATRIPTLYYVWLNAGTVYATVVQGLSSDTPGKVISLAGGPNNTFPTSAFDFMNLSFEQVNTTIATNTPSVIVVEAGMVRIPNTVLAP
jgi:hypothetical protein